MNRLTRGLAPRVAGPLCLAVAGVMMPPVRAADDSVREGAATAEQQAEQEGNLVDLGANFDTNVFEQTGNGWVIRQARQQLGGLPERAVGEGVGSPAMARARAVGTSRLEQVDRACELDDDQRRKLRLALEADIRRCVAEIDEVRRTYAGMMVNMREREGQQKWSRFQQDVQRCRRRLMTLFDESSLFAESLATVLDPAQLGQLVAETAARRSFRWRSLVASAMLRLDDTLALTQEQHDVIERLLVEKEPPLRLDARTRQRNEQAEQMLVFMVLAEVDQKALKDAVGEDRWKTVLTLANQGRSMRSWIEGQGLLEPKRK